MKKRWKALIWAAVAVFALVAGAMFIMGRQVNALEQLDFAAVNTAALADGKYRGSAQALLVQAEVEVTVHKGRLTEVYLLRHFNGMGAAADVIVEHMVLQNTVDVDAIAGATASSTVIKAAAP